MEQGLRLVRGKLDHAQKQSTESDMARENTFRQLMEVSRRAQFLGGKVNSLKTLVREAAKACSDADGFAEEQC